MEQQVSLDDETVHVVQDGARSAPVVVLIHGLGASTVWWDPVVPDLAAAYRVVRIDLRGHGGSADPAGASEGYDIPAQARRIGMVLDHLGITRVAAAIGHSTGGYVVTALAEQRPGLVGALALIDSGPSPESDTSDSPLSRLLFARFPGALLWLLLKKAIIRKSLASAFTRPVEIPEAIVDATRGMTHRALAGTARGSLHYIQERPMPDRLAGLPPAPPLPILIVFGTEDHRWRSSAAEELYRTVPGAKVVMLPGVGHTPMYEDTRTTCALLLEFADSVTAAAES